MDKIDIPKSVDDVTVSQLREWLFRCYNEIEYYDSHDEVNEKSRKYHLVMIRD